MSNLLSLPDDLIGNILDYATDSLETRRQLQLICKTIHMISLTDRLSYENLNVRIPQKKKQTPSVFLRNLARSCPGLVRRSPSACLAIQGR